MIMKIEVSKVKGTKRCLLLDYLSKLGFMK